MRNNTVFQKFTREDIKVFGEVIKLIDLTINYLDIVAILYKKNKIEFRCHSICRAVAYHVSTLKIVDGYYLGLKENKPKEYSIGECEHSWLVTGNGTIIDPYPVGVFALSPLMVPPEGPIFFGKELYVPEKSVKKIAEQKAFMKEAHRLIRIMGKAKV